MLKGGEVMKKLILVLIMVLVLTNAAHADDTDKVLHFAGGMAIQSLGEYFEVKDTFKLVLFAAATKELLDYFTGGSIDVQDIGATMLGGYVVRYEF